jgi:hypothetical protein
MTTPLETAFNDFYDNTGIMLRGRMVEDTDVWETMSGNNPDEIRYQNGTHQVTHIIATGFSFEVDGESFSGNLNDLHLNTYNHDTCMFNDENNEADVLKAIKKVCGRINYGNTALGV